MDEDDEEYAAWLAKASNASASTTRARYSHRKGSNVPSALQDGEAGSGS